MFGFLLILIVNVFVLLDAVILKSRYLIISFGFLFVSLILYELYYRTFEDTDIGVILLDYSIQGKSYKIMKRSTKRSIFLQILLFSANGIYTVFVDKSMKLMVFATAIYSKVREPHRKR